MGTARTDCGGVIADRAGGGAGAHSLQRQRICDERFFEALRAQLKPRGVSVTLAYPGVVDTRIRYHGYHARGEAAGHSGLKEDDAMPVAECARLMLAGMQHRQREVVMPPRGKLGRWLKLLAPGVVERMALAALQDEVQPHGAPAGAAYIGRL